MRLLELSIGVLLILAAGVLGLAFLILRGIDRLRASRPVWRRFGL